MLCLKLKVGDQFRIDGDITVTVLEIRGGTVRLGTDAPDSKPIDRMEVCVRMDKGMSREDAIADYKASKAKPVPC
jgi:carbon storage regulator